MKVRVAFAIFLSLLLSACFASEDRLTIKTVSDEIEFSIEVADTPEERSKGLMFRTELDHNKGMLFDFGKEQEVSFWMRNTLIPLDMIFITASGEISNIHVNAKPHDPTPIPSHGKVRFVLEIAGGNSVVFGIKPGDQIDHPRISER